MTNPNNAIGTNGAFGGRTSVNAFNDSLGSYSAGVLSGWECSPSSGLDVILGGDGNVRDVAIAEDNAGNKTTINNISGSPVQVTIGEAPATNSRIDLIVAYVDNPPTGSATITDNYEACGLIVVEGVASATPVAPNDSAIRTAITADGASGTTAYYVVLAQITIENGTTDLTNDNIAVGSIAQIGAHNIDFATFGVPVPDYANVQSFSTNTYTAPTDGFVRIRADVGTGGNKGSAIMVVSITRNGVQYGGSSSGNYFDVTGYNHSYVDVTLPVKAGDIIDIGYLGSSVDWTSRDFYPVLW